MARFRAKVADAVLKWMSRHPRLLKASDRWRAWLEDHGVLSPYLRLIVVCGMARTGTSALAAYIGSHPRVNLVVHGRNWFRAEVDFLLGKTDWNTIDRLLRENRPNCILLKRPWLQRQLEFFEKASDAKVIVCYRHPDTLFMSWFHSRTAGKDGRKNQQKVYDNDLPYCDALVNAGALRVDREELGTNQAERLGEFLNMDPEGFVPWRIKRRWLALEEKRWLRENTIWLGTGKG